MYHLIFPKERGAAALMLNIKSFSEVTSSLAPLSIERAGGEDTN